MHTTHLRKVGGSIMLRIPPALLDVLHLNAGATVDLTLEDGRLIVAPVPVPRYTLADLLAECDPALPLTDEDRQWLDAPAVGNELL